MANKRLKAINKIRIMNAHSRTVGRRVHAEARLKERFGLEYTKVKKAIDNNGFKVLFEKKRTKICYISYCDQDIYFVTSGGEISTFLTKEMVESSHPEAFEPKKKKKKKNKDKQKKRKKLRGKQAGKLIPASELFKK
jgi:hypothetical protein